MDHIVEVAPEKPQQSISPMRFTNQNSISYEVYHPILMLGKVLGLISWHTRHPSLNLNPCSLFRIALSFIYKSVIFLLLTVLNAYKTKALLNIDYDSQVTFLTENASNVAQLGFLFSIHVLCLFKEHCFWNLIKLTFVWDKTLQKTIKVGWFHFKHNVFQVLFTILIIFLFTVSMLNSPLFNTYCLTLFSEYHFQVTDLFASVSFITASYLCSECFSAVNKDLKDVFNSQPAALNDELHQIRLKYEQLYELAAALQLAFSCLITLELAQLTLFLCLQSYLMLLDQYSIFRVAMIIHIIMRVYRIFTIAAAAGNLTKQGQRGLESLHNVSNKNIPYEVGFQVTALCNKLSQSPVEIVAAGNLFRVNMSTFTTIMGTILTYLIVLVQFRSPTPVSVFQENATMSNITQ